MTGPVRRVVVTGFGAAGLAVAQELRARGWSGRLTVLAEEALIPYDRPPLTKGFLTGTVEPAQLQLASAESLDALGLELRYGVRAASLDSRSRVVTDTLGEAHPFDALVVATGVRPRTLGAEVVRGVHVLRTMDDAERLRESLTSAGSLVIVGGGFLGLEVAASARTMGLEVTVVEPTAEPLRARLGHQLSDRLLDLHREHGVRLRLSTGVTAVTAVTGGEPEVVLTDGTRLRADAVLLAVGAVPDIAWLAGSDVPVGDGVLCDERCRAGPGVWAAGDVARWHHLALGTDTRIEHRMNATEQGRAVARGILGEDRPFVPVPFVWTDHYGVRLQVAGHPFAGIDPQISIGDGGSDSFAVEWRDDGLACVGGWNAARAIMPARRELAAGWMSVSTGSARGSAG